VLTPSDRAAWIACSFMACASMAIILGCSIHYGTHKAAGEESQCGAHQQLADCACFGVDHLPAHMIWPCVCVCPAGTPTQVLGPIYYSIQGPAGSVPETLSSEAARSVAEACHRAMALPGTYPIDSIHAELVQPAGVSPAGSVPAALRHLLQQPQPGMPSTVVLAISLQSCPEIPDAASLHTRTASEDTANDMLFNLVAVKFIGACCDISCHACCAGPRLPCLSADHPACLALCRCW
jgi:hypothetical protein